VPKEMGVLDGVRHLKRALQVNILFKKNKSLAFKTLSYPTDAQIL